MTSNPGGKGIVASASTGSRRREAMRAAARAHGRTPSPRSPAATAAQPRTIFVSYSRHDIEAVRRLVDWLRARGATVAWDQDFAAGADFEQASRQAIDAATSVIVVWSPASARSRYVRDEAQRALRTSRLVPMYIKGFDLAEIPLGFGHLNAVRIDDADWLRRSLAEHGIELHD